MSLGYATIVTSITRGRERQLRDHLRENVQPKFNPNDRVDIIECQSSLPFDEVKGLHLCSMVIVDGVEKSDLCCLVFEATFDGSREEFFDDLLRLALPGIDEIYKHCEDYPVSGPSVPALIKDYLIRHDVGAQTFYSGSPGRSVAQIWGERNLRQNLVHHIDERRGFKDGPTTFLGLQRELQREVRKDAGSRWAELPAVVPWEITYRKLTAFYLVLASLGLAWLVGVLIRYVVVRYVVDWPLLNSLLAWVQGLIDWPLLNSLLAWVQGLNSPPVMLSGLIAAWLVLRGIAFFVEAEDPRQTNFYWRLFAHILYVLRVALLVLFVLRAVDPTLAWALPPGESVVYIALFGAGAALFAYFATSARLAVQFQALSPTKETIRSLLLEFFIAAIVVCAACAFIILKPYLFLPYFFLKPYLPEVLTQIISSVVAWFSARYEDLYAVFFATLLGVLAFYFVVICGAMLVRSMEAADRRRYAAAAALISKTIEPSCYAAAAALISKTIEPSSVYEREEGGVNKYQNHLASLTYVKPGILRIALLRVTLFAVRLLARFWFNQGDLGGIPTILAARWALIDGGRRLLFLTNYGGGWDSYLDEFIDMGAVQGLNAIWTNTFIKSGDSRYAFPATEFYLWRGAQAEQPFKAYVRHSQVETLVWYSAYPTLSIKNVNANTDLRQALFKSLPACELNVVFARAGL